MIPSVARVAQLLGIAISTYLGVRLLGALDWTTAHKLCLSATQGASASANGSSVLTIVDACLLSPIVEEYVFRKWLIGRLARHLPSPGALLASAFLFAAAHLAVYGPDMGRELPLFALGMVLGAVYIRSGDVRHSIAVHMMFNTIVIYPKHEFSTCIDLSPLAGFSAASIFIALLLFYLKPILFGQLLPLASQTPED
jgi:membrane protease YdiL (CAAX protease family)